MASREQKPPARAHVAFPLMPLNTATNNASTGSNNASSASLSNSGDTRYPPTAAQAKESLRSKRPADSPISLNADKRARINGPSEQSRSNAASPVSSRQNSMTATVGPSPARRPSTMSSGGNIVHASRDPRRQGTGHVGSASPMHAASPLSMTNGYAGQHSSGNTTPIHGAPPAPSMVPQKRAPGVGGARGLASIRQTIAKKQKLPGVSENTVMASIRAGHINLLNEMKKVTDQLALLQTEQDKAIAQRDHVETDLKEQLSQLHVKLGTEKKQKLEVEQRLQALESKFERFQNTPADPGVSAQMNELSSKVQQLESLPRSDTSAEIQSQFEKSVKELVPSDIKAHGHRITELETKITAIGTLIEQAEPKFEAIIKQSIEKAITPFKSRFDSVENGAKSITTRIDALVIEDNKTRLDKLEQGLGHRVDKLEKDVNTVTTKPDTSDKQIKNLSEKDIQVLKKDIEGLKNANPSREIADLKDAFAVERQNTAQQFEEVKSEMREKATITQYELVAKQLDEVSEPVKSYVDEHIEEQVPSHVNPIIAALKEENDNFENDIKRDIGAAFAKMREDMERNEGTLRETNSLAGRNETTVNDLVSSVSQLREDIASKANHLRQEMRNSIASMEKGSQSDISESDLSSALTDIQLDILNFKTETSSKIKGLRDDIARPRTAPAASPANPIVTASALQGFATNEKLKELNGHLQEVESSLRNFATTERLDKLDTHLREVENTATTALAEATAVVDITIKFATDMDGFTSKSRTIEQAMEALRDHVASLREQPSSRPGNAESALTSRFSGSDHDATNIVREDTRAGNEAIESRLQSQERAIKSLTSQYDNITTDYLHQRMSYWIAQNYPDAPDFLNELKRMQVKLELVETFVNDMSWMSADNQQIFGLVRRSDAIQQLLRDKDRLGHTSAWEDFGSIRNRIEMEAQTRTNELEALRDELATERSDRQRLASGLKPVHDAFGKSLPEVELLRNELNNLKPTLELLGTEFDDLKPKVQRLETESGKLEPKVQCLEVNFGKLEPKVEQLETKTNKLDTAKQLSDNSIRELDNQNGRLDKRLELAETRMGKAENSIQEHTQNLSAQGQLIGNVNSTIEQRGRTLETHQQFLNKFGANIATLTVTAYELQKFSLMINSCLRSGGYKNIEFTHTFSEPTSVETWTSL